MQDKNCKKAESLSEIMAYKPLKLHSWEKRLLGLYDCRCIMANPLIDEFHALNKEGLCTTDTVELGLRLMNIHHITEQGEDLARQIKSRMRYYG